MNDPTRIREPEAWQWARIVTVETRSSLDAVGGLLFQAIRKRLPDSMAPEILAGRPAQP